MAFNLKCWQTFGIILVDSIERRLKLWFWLLIVGVSCLIVGFIIGFFVIRSVFTKQLEKNPPINRDMIRAMFMQMGRKPSEKDITRVMNSMNQYK